MSHVQHFGLFTYGVATISRLLKIVGLFCKRAYKTDDILQKRPIILRSLLTVATPPYVNESHAIVVPLYRCLHSFMSDVRHMNEYVQNL